MRPLAGLSVLVVLCCTGLAACGGASKVNGAASRASASGATRDESAESRPALHESLAAPARGDGDGDSAERSAFDADDFHSMHFGHAADPVDERTIAAIVKRYYAALAAQDAPAVCSLLLEVIAESLPEDQPAGSGSVQQVSAPGRTTCPAAISGVLAESHRALLSKSRTLHVIGVRVRRRRASALLRFGGTSARHILLYKEGGAWKIGTLADEDLG